ncbi:unnamed protein product [Clonostachys rhizophaga]|uniref:Uncharacterized protein n=1 Tax=Clonostachys rhizophaga TaxID=160324 RepID=A0A9N9YH44_9HYPO|nr:unnamed protein product [Clonostachys rhizophaga]
MPCCFATLKFRQCGHSMLFKLGCSKSECAEICPSKRRQFLLQTEYMWRCEDCVEFEYKQSSDLKASEWDTYYARIRSNRFLSPENRESLTLTARNREIRQEAARDQRRSGCVEEIQRVVDWVEEYGGLVWDLVYGHKRDFEESKNRLQFLRAAKYWDLIVVLDYVRKARDPWDKENFPNWIDNLIQEIRGIRPATPAAGPETPRSAGGSSALPAFRGFQSGMCRMAALDEAAELTQRMTDIDIQGSGSSSDITSESSSDIASESNYVLESGPARKMSPDEIPRSLPNEPSGLYDPNDYLSILFNADVVMKDDDASSILSTDKEEPDYIS